MKVNSTGTCSKRRSDHSLLCATIALAMAALIGAAGFGSAALAQSGPTQAIAADDLFAGPESADFKGGVGVGVDRLVNVVKQAQQPGSQCPTDVDFTVMGGPHPDGPVLSEALARARRDAIEAVLRGFGPSVRVTAKPTTSGLVSMVFISAQTAKDNEKPKLDVTWTPPKGTKVSVGTRITAKAVARDDANRWQSGIKTIDLDVQGGGQFGFGDYPRPPQTCESPPPAQTLDGVYTVRANPPPIVRLRARASDFAGHFAQDIAEYPTKGDWYGHIDWSIPHRYGRQWGRLDITFDYDGQGNLKGEMAGDEHMEQQWASCHVTTLTPAKLSANLVGQYTPGRNAMSLRVADQQFEQGQRSGAGCGPSPPGPFGGGGPLHQPGLAQLLNNLTVRADGGVDASGEWPVTPASVQSTLHLKLTLRRVQN